MPSLSAPPERTKAPSCPLWMAWATKWPTESRWTRSVHLMLETTQQSRPAQTPLNQRPKTTAPLHSTTGWRDGPLLLQVQCAGNPPRVDRGQRRQDRLACKFWCVFDEKCRREDSLLADRCCLCIHFRRIELANHHPTLCVSVQGHPMGSDARNNLKAALDKPFGGAGGSGSAPAPTEEPVKTRKMIAGVCALVSLPHAQ
jgi:hypothetical protein